MNDIGWQIVVLVVAALAALTARDLATRPTKDKRLDELAEKIAEWPAVEQVLGRLDELEAAVDAMQSSGNTLGAVVSRANDLTKDMLAMKTLLVEHKEQIAALRSRTALRAMGGIQE